MMRIITGINKGRKLIRPRLIRPTQNKVRKALFDILGDIEGLSFLELYAGSGAVGFEAASRGVKELVLVEYDRDCLKAIQQNIDSLKLKVCNIFPGQAEAAIAALHKDKRLFDIVFMDPPYYEELPKKTLQTLGAYDIVAPDGLVIVQHHKKDALPDTLGDLHLIRQKEYGDTLLSIYRKG